MREWHKCNEGNGVPVSIRTGAASYKQLVKVSLNLALFSVTFLESS